MLRCVVLIVICIFAVGVTSQASKDCRFAYKYTAAELWNSEEKQQEFLSDVMYWEGNFAKHHVGLNRFSGLTYDGHGIDYSSGVPNEGYLHFWSAPSKESIHLIMLAKALQMNSLALQFVCNTCKSEEDQYNHAILLLTNKIKSYNLFNTQYPGFAGFLPWFDVNDSGCYPNDGWVRNFYF